MTLDLDGAEEEGLQDVFERERERERERETKKVRDRERQRQRETARDRQKDRLTDAHRESILDLYGAEEEGLPDVFEVHQHRAHHCFCLLLFHRAHLDGFKFEVWV